MNWYAEIARAYFTRRLPQWYEQIEDPDRFFTEVGAIPPGGRVRR